MKIKIIILKPIARLLIMASFAMGLFLPYNANAQYEYIPNGGFENLTDGKARYPNDSFFLYGQSWKYCKEWFCPNNRAVVRGHSMFIDFSYPEFIKNYYASYAPYYTNDNLYNGNYYKIWGEYPFKNDPPYRFQHYTCNTLNCAKTGKGLVLLTQFHIDKLPYNFDSTSPHGYTKFYPDLKNARTYTSVKLKNNLQKGMPYECSFFVRIADKPMSCNFAASNTGSSTIFANDIGVGLSSYAPTQIGTKQLNIKQIWRTPKIIDNTCWEQVSFTFIADSNYSYLTLGCFTNSKNVKYRINYNVYDSTSLGMKYYFQTRTWFDDISLQETMIFPKVTGDKQICKKGYTTLYCKNAGAYTQWYAGGNIIGKGDSIKLYISKDTQIVAGYGGFYDTVNIYIQQKPTIELKDTFYYTGGNVNIIYPIAGYKYQWDKATKDSLQNKIYTTPGLKFLDISTAYCSYRDSFEVKEINPFFKLTTTALKACTNTNITFKTNKYFRNYDWKIDNQIIKNQKNINYNFTQKGKYNVIASYDTLNYTFSDTIAIEILDYPKSNLPKLISECNPLNKTHCLVFNQVNITFNWSDNTSDSCKTFIHTNIYYLNYTNKYCNSKDTIEIIEKSLPYFKLSQIDTPCLDGTNFSVLQIFPDTFYSIQWQPDFINTNKINIHDTANRTVYVTANNGCKNTLTIKPINGCNMFFYVPNAFSPNDDEVNDIFNIKGLFIGKLKMSIYNQWGELIFYTENITKGWDGSYKNTPCMQGNYLVKISLQSEKTLNGIAPFKYWSGTVQLLR